MIAERRTSRRAAAESKLHAREATLAQQAQELAEALVAIKRERVDA